MSAPTPPCKASQVLIPGSFEEFKEAGSKIMRRDPKGCSVAVFEDRWITFFGVPLPVVVTTWELLAIEVNDERMGFAKPWHLLWGLMWLKMYGNESEMAALCGGSDFAVNEKTYCKWAHLFIECISYLMFDLVIYALSSCPLLSLIEFHSYFLVPFLSSCRWCGMIERRMTSVMIAL